jgi:hypothetical protein
VTAPSPRWQPAVSFPGWTTIFSTADGGAPFLGLKRHHHRWRWQRSDEVAGLLVPGVVATERLEEVLVGSNSRRRHSVPFYSESATLYI